MSTTLTETGFWKVRAVNYCLGSLSVWLSAFRCVDLSEAYFDSHFMLGQDCERDAIGDSNDRTVDVASFVGVCCAVIAYSVDMEWNQEGKS